MSEITDLQTLKNSIKPILKPCGYVFTTFDDIAWRLIAYLKPKSVFKEDEGYSLVM